MNMRKEPTAADAAAIAAAATADNRTAHERAADILYPADAERRRLAEAKDEREPPSASSPLFRNADGETVSDAENRLADAFYGNGASDEGIRQLYEPSLGSTMNRLQDFAGWTPEERKQHGIGVARFFAGASIDSGDAAALYSLFAHHVQEPADDRTVRDWETETRRILRERYGDEAPKRLATVREYVSQFKDLGALLDQSGLGSHPNLVTALVERADRLRKRL